MFRSNIITVPRSREPIATTPALSRAVLYPLLGVVACACLAAPVGAQTDESLDRDGLVLAIAPPPSAEGIQPETVFEVLLAAEPLVAEEENARWWRLEGSQSGPRTADECRVEIDPVEGNTYARARLECSRPFMIGESVSLILLRGWPLIDGRRLPGVLATYRIGAGGSGILLAADASERLAPSSDEPRVFFDDVQRLEVETGPNMVVAADLDRDGYVDLAVSEILGDDSIDIFLNSGNGRLLYEESVHVDGLEDPGRFTAGDIDGDGNTDLVVLGQRSGNVAILRGTPEGSPANAGSLLEFKGFLDIDAATPLHASVADVDLDGRSDILLTYLGGDTILLYRGDAEAETGLAAREQLKALPGVQDLVVTHLDANLQPDIALVSGQNNTLAVLLGSEDTLDPFAPQSSFAVPTGHRPRAVVSGDLNHDGAIDLAVTQEGSNDVAVFLGRGDGTFEPPITHPVGDRPTAPAIADFDGDGNLDLAIPNHFSDEVTLLFGVGDGSFDGEQTLLVDAGPASIAAADFDGDADIDLAVVNSVADRVTLYLNRREETRAGDDDDEPRSLAQNTPNPFNPNTTITFTLLSSSKVNLVVFNTSGKVVRTLVDEVRQAGQHTAFWDGTDERGENQPSGIYFYRLTTDETVELRRMTLLR
jgi:hypothetical protein